MAKAASGDGPSRDFTGQSLSEKVDHTERPPPGQGAAQRRGGGGTKSLYKQVKMYNSKYKIIRTNKHILKIHIKRSKV